MKATTRLAFVIGLSVTAAMTQAQEEPRSQPTSRPGARVFEFHAFGRGYIGIQLTPLTPELRTHFGVPEDAGVLVARVEEESPAETAGILVGDILTAIDGERIDDADRLSRTVRRKKEGETVTLELYRNDGLESYPVTVSERDRPVIDLAGGYRFIPEGDLVPKFDFRILAPGVRIDERSLEAFENAIEDLGERFESPEWQEKVERLKDLDFTAIQERMKEVERRLQELEEELEREVKKKL